jgi:PLP dependent protein
MISQNLKIIRERIKSAANLAGRDPDEIRIVAAAKGQSPVKIVEAIKSGINIIGQNYIQEAVEVNSETALPGVQFHMIGHLQKNKAGKAVELFDVIETIDNEELSGVLSRRAGALGKTLGILIQVNLSGEPQKSGLKQEEVERLATLIRDLPALNLLGLMTMPPFFDEPDRARPYFAALRELSSRLIDTGILARNMNELSMGMTGDFEVAVEEGATLVRIGTALFGPRQ